MSQKIAEFFASLGLELDEASFKKAEANFRKTSRVLNKQKTTVKKLKSAYGQLRKVAVGAAAIFTTGLIARQLNSIADSADRVAKQSRAFGLSIKEFQGFQFAAERSGLSMDQFRIALSAMPKKLSAAAMGSKELQETFRTLGTSTQELLEMSPADQFRAIGRGLSTIENPTKKAGIAFKLFEESGANLLPLFSDGADGLAKLEAEFEALGGGITEKAAKNAEIFKDELTNLMTAMKAVSSQILEGIVPAITSSLRGLREFFGSTERIRNALSSLILVLSPTAALLATRFAPAIWSTASGFIATVAPAAALTLAMLALGLAFDDIVRTLVGHDTVLSRFISWLDQAKHGTGLLAAVVQPLDALFNGFGETLAALLDPTETLASKIDALFRQFSKLFGLETFGRLFDATFGTVDAPAVPQGSFDRAALDASISPIKLQGSFDRAALDASISPISVPAAGTQSVSVQGLTINVNGGGTDVAQQVQQGVRQGMSDALISANDRFAPGAAQ